MFTCFIASLSVFLPPLLSVYLFQCDRVQVIPMPSACVIIIFHFISSQYPPPLCLLCTIILAARGHIGNFSLPSNQISNSISSPPKNVHGFHCFALWFPPLFTTKWTDQFFLLWFIWGFCILFCLCSIITGGEHEIDFLGTLIVLTRAQHFELKFGLINDKPIKFCIKLDPFIEMDYIMLVLINRTLLEWGLGFSERRLIWQSHLSIFDSMWLWASL